MYINIVCTYRKGAIIMQNSSDIKTTTKVFSNGNSDAIRITKKLKEAMNLTAGDDVELLFNPSTNKIEISKITTDPKISPEFKKRFDRLYAENAGLMERLKNL